MRANRKLVPGGLFCAVVLLTGCGGGPRKGEERQSVTIAGKVTDSPIMASGGSLTFRSPTAWTCNPARTACSTQPAAPLTTINQDDLDSQSGPPPNLPPISQPWTIQFAPRNAQGGLNGAAGVSVTLCSATSDFHDQNCGGNNPSLVKVFVVGGPLLIQSRAREDQTKLTAVQYYDAGCQVHGIPTAPGSTTDTPIIPIPACEHPGVVTYADGKPYTCLHGACRVYIK